MKQSIIFLLLLPVFMNAQSTFTPNVEVDNYPIQDVLYTDTSTIYCTTKGVYEVKADNSILEIEEARHLTVQNEFTLTDEGWVLLGYDISGGDYIISGFELIVNTGDSIYSKSKIYYLPEEFDYNIVDMAFESVDSIYALVEDSGNYSLAILNSDGDIVNLENLMGSSFSDILSVEHGVVLLVNGNTIQRYENFELTASYSAGFIIDINFHREDDYLEVINEDKLIHLDVFLNPIKQISLPQDENEIVAGYHNGGVSYLLYQLEDNSYIHGYDSLGALVYQHESIFDLEYNDLMVQGGRFTVWGRNSCSRSNHFIKMDIDGFDSEFELTNLNIDFFEAELDSIVFDTIVQSNGNEYIRQRVTFGWKLRVVNEGESTIDKVKVISNSPYLGNPSYIYFESEEILEPGESIEFDGSFSFYTSVFSSVIHLIVHSDKLDSDCEDNHVFQLLETSTTSTSQLEVKKLSIYPNPTTDKINIDVSGGVNYKISDNTGKSIIEGVILGSAVDVSSLCSGIYFLTVMSPSEGVITKKFVKI